MQDDLPARRVPHNKAEAASGARAAALVWLAVQSGLVPAEGADITPISAASLSRLSIEELAEIEVSSVSKRPERLGNASAAVYVITREDILRSGVSTLPEALRLAPNLQVARVSSSTYAITARGFNSSSANKLLVMIDGRSVYTPLHSGVFWDVQDLMLADIERIEVVSGPGGTLWGANAVNGVINILTRRSGDTQGTLVHAEGGNADQGVAVRHGLRLGGDAFLRIHARSQRFDNTVRENGTPVADAWRRKSIGFRADGTRLSDTLTLQGDAYEGSLQRQSAGALESSARRRGERAGAGLLRPVRAETADGLQRKAQDLRHRRAAPLLVEARP